MMRRVALVLLLSLTACGGSDNGTEPENVHDFGGTWTFSMTINGPNDLVCTFTGFTMVIAQTGADFTGTATNGAETCTRNSQSWPPDVVESIPISDGIATGVGVTFKLREGGTDATFTGTPVISGGWEGTATGSAELDAFGVGVVAVTGTWTATR